MKKDIFPLLLILVFSTIVSLPLLVPGLHQIHDDQQVVRLFLFDEALKAGQFPVRWVSGLGFGFGYPLFVFYPPFVYMVGEVFHLSGFTFIDSIKLVFATSILTSGIAMYIFTKGLWGRIPALVASIFYIFIPYRALDIYVRGALAESFSFVWLPLILWSIYKIRQTDKITHVFAASIFLSLLMITHNLIFLPFAIILAIYILFLFFQTSKKTVFVTNIIKTAVLSAGLSAFFWMPALLEKKFTIVDELLLVNLANYNIHFVYPQQLWNWTWGFGGSAKGLADGISFKIGKLNLVLSVLSFIVSVVLLAKGNLKEKLPLILSFLLFFSAFMTTFYSKPLWDIISPLQYLQFPWRFLTFTAVFSALLSGYFIFILKLPVFRVFASLLVISLMVIPNLKLFRPQAYRQSQTDKIATAKDTINWDISYSSFEYIPKGFPLTVGPLATNIADVQKSNLPKDIANIDPVSGKIRSQEIKPHKMSFTIDANRQLAFVTNVFNFPGWTAKVDKKEAKITDENKFRLITIDIPSGIHNVNIEFHDTNIRRIANFITVTSLVFMLTFFTKKWHKIN